MPDGLSETRPTDHPWKGAKRRHSDKRRATKRTSYALSDINLQVPEEALFQQLLGRLRAREESEAVALDRQKEMEQTILALSEENKVLKEELEILGSKLQKRTMESRAYKYHTDSWKSKLAKVKVFLNELGIGYQNLRGEAIHLKATRKTLDKERKEITESIGDIKSRMYQISQASQERRGGLSEAQTLMALLGEQLKDAREMAQYSQDQLTDEKKRSRLLELYIQNCSRAQDKKLELIKTNQLEAMKRLEFAFDSTTKRCESSRAVFGDAFEEKLNNLIALIGTSNETFSNCKLDLLKCNEAIHTFETW